MRIRKQQRSLASSSSGGELQCSLPTCFSRATTSNWLDKLRATKGFLVEPNSSGDSAGTGLASNATVTTTTTMTMTTVTVVDQSSPAAGPLPPADLTRASAETMASRVGQSSSSPESASPPCTTATAAALLQPSPSGEDGLSLAPPPGPTNAVSGCGQAESSGVENGMNRSCSSGHSCTYAFGLPATDFEQSGNGAGASTKRNKRKQDRPRSCPGAYDWPAQEVTGPLLLQQQRKGGQAASVYLQERASPPSDAPNPSCKTQLVLCSQEGLKNRGYAAGRNRDGLRVQVQVGVIKRPRELCEDTALNDEDLTDEMMPRFKMPRRRLQSSNNRMNGRLPPDHPARQAEDTLAFSVYQVYMKAGKCGLTAREAVSRILEEGLPGLEECGVVPRVEVGKIVRTSPYFMELEESKFVLCSAITGDKSKQQRQQGAGEQQQQQKPKQMPKSEEQMQTQNWAALAVRRARTGKTRRKQSVVAPPPVSLPKPVVEEDDKPRKRRLKSVQQDKTGLGNRCNRSDGKGWHCPLLAQVGYLLCDHHLDRLRAKSGSKARRPSKAKAAAAAAAAAAATAAAAAAEKKIGRGSAAVSAVEVKRKRERDNSWAAKKSLAKGVRLLKITDDGGAGGGTSTGTGGGGAHEVDAGGVVVWEQ